MISVGPTPPFASIPPDVAEAGGAEGKPADDSAKYDLPVPGSTVPTVP